MEYISAAATGLQLAEQLVKVGHGAWKLSQKLAAAPRQIRRKRVYVGQLQTHSEALQGFFQGPHEKHDPRNQSPHPNQSDALQNLLDKIEKEFDDLNNILEPLEAAHGSDTSVKRFWARVRTLKHEDTIHGSLDRIKELSTHLHYFVELYHLALFCNTAARNNAALENLTGAQTQLSGTVAQIHQKLDDKAHADDQMWSMNQKSQDALITQGQATHASLDKIDASLASGFDLMSKTVGRDLEQISKDLKTVHRSVQLLTAGRLASKPSVVARVLDQNRRWSRGRCPCHRSGRTAPAALGPIAWERRDYGIHRPGCPYHVTDAGSVTAARYSLTIRKLLSLTVELVFTGTKGAGGFAVPDHINFIRIVNDGDTTVPGFDRLSDARREIQRALGYLTGSRSFRISPYRSKLLPRQADRMEQILKQLWHDLEADFQSGRTSGRVQSTRGNTLLHMFIEIVMEIWTVQEDVAGTVQAIIDLLHRYGTPLNATVWAGSVVIFNPDSKVPTWRHDYYNTALSQCIAALNVSDFQSARSRTFLQMLSDLGVDSSPPNAEDVSPSAHVGLFIAVPDLAIEHGCSRLALAVINREADEVRTILRKKGVQDSETPPPLTPLCFCTNWPSGNRLLLEAGANPSEAVRFFVDYEDDIGLEILLNAGSRLFAAPDGASNASRHFLDEAHHPYSLLEYALWRKRCPGTGNARIIPLVISAIVTARQNLMTLARSKMSQSQLRKLGWQNPQYDQPLLDSSSAFAIFEHLQMRNIKMQDSMQPDHRALSIYHNPWMTADVAEALFQAGFRDIDTISPNGSTPLLQNAHARSRSPQFETPNILLWFLAQGAKTLVFPGLNGTSLYHKLAAEFALTFSRESRHDRRNWRQWLPCVLEELSAGLSERPRDSCTCYCSERGCSPVTSLLMHQTHPPFHSYLRKCADEYNLWDKRRRMFDCWWKMNPQWLNTGAFNDLCRFEIFERLGMRHTCCQFCHGRRDGVKNDDVTEDGYFLEYLSEDLLFVDRDEAREFQQEDQYLHDVLKRVMTLFDDLSRVYQRHFAVFWEAWWMFIEASIPPTLWKSESLEWAPERIDAEIPSLDEGALEGILQEVSENVSNWVQVKCLEEEDLTIAEGMAWLTGLLDEE